MVRNSWGEIDNPVFAEQQASSRTVENLTGVNSALSVRAAPKKKDTTLADFGKGFSAAAQQSFGNTTMFENIMYGDNNVFGIPFGDNIATRNARTAEAENKPTFDAEGFKNMTGYTLPNTLSLVSAEDALGLQAMFQRREATEQALAGGWFTPMGLGATAGSIGGALSDPVNFAATVASVLLPGLAVGAVASTARLGYGAQRTATWLQTASMLRNTTNVLPSASGFGGLATLGAIEGAAGAALTASNEASNAENIYGQEFDHVGFLVQNILMGAGLELGMGGLNAVSQMGSNALKRTPGLTQNSMQSMVDNIAGATGMSRGDAWEVVQMNLNGRAQKIPAGEAVKLLDDELVEIHPDAQPYIPVQVKELADIPAASRQAAIDTKMLEMRTLLDGADEFGGLEHAPINLGAISDSVDSIMAFIPEDKRAQFELDNADIFTLIGKRQVAADPRLPYMSIGGMQQEFGRLNTLMSKQYTEIINATNNFNNLGTAYTGSTLTIKAFANTAGKFVAMSEHMVNRGLDIDPALKASLARRGTKLHKITQEIADLQVRLKDEKFIATRAADQARIATLGKQVSRRLATWKGTLALNTPMMADIKAVFGDDSALVKRMVAAGAKASQFATPEQIARQVRDSTLAGIKNMEEMVVNNVIAGTNLRVGAEEAATAGVQSRIGQHGRGNTEYAAYNKYLRDKQVPHDSKSMTDYVNERSMMLKKDVTTLQSLYDNAEANGLPPATRAYIKDQLDFLTKDEIRGTMDVEQFTKAALDALDCLITGGSLDDG